MKKTTLSLLLSATAISLATMAPAQAAVDADAAQAMFKKDQCTKCHAVDKDKKGASLKKTAAKYKGKADAEESIIKSMTNGAKVKLSDGTEEEHKILTSKDAKEQKNLAAWILSH